MDTNKNKNYRTLGFGEKVRCFFKDINGGVYDIYICDKCIVNSINKTELEILVKILKLEEI
jgi:hypothetical protein